MATQISSMWVGLTGNVSGLAKSFGSALKPIAGVNRELMSLSGVYGKVSAIAGAGLAALGAYSFTSLVKESLEAIDVNAKLSDRLGITTEALTGLQHAGDLAGISSDQLTGGIEKMLKTFAGIKEDGGDSANAISNLGLDVKKLKKIASDDAFGQIADKIAGIENPTDRAAAAVAVFGKSGQSLLPLLMAGSAGMREATAEAKKLGISFSRLDAAKVEAANDAMTRARRVATGLGRAIAIELSPYLEALSIKFTETATSGDGMRSSVVGASKALSLSIAKAADVVEHAQAVWYGFQAGVAGGLWTLRKPFDMMIQRVDYMVNKLTGSRTWFGGFSEGLQDGLNDQATEALNKSLDHYRRAANGINSKGVSDFFDDLDAKAREAAAGVGKNASEVDRLKRSLDALKPSALSAGSAQAQAERYAMAATATPVAKVKPESIKPPTTKPAAAALAPPLPSNYAIKDRQRLTDNYAGNDGNYRVNSKSGISATLTPDMRRGLSDALNAAIASPAFTKKSQAYPVTRNDLSDPKKIVDGAYGATSRGGINAVLDAESLANLRAATAGPSSTAFAEWQKTRKPESPSAFDEWKAGVVPLPVERSAIDNDAKETGKKQVGELTKQTQLLMSIEKKTGSTLQGASF